MLGEGAFAVVFSGFNRKTGDAVAIKMLRMERYDKAPLIRQMEKEIGILQRLEHPYIVNTMQVYSVCLVEVVVVGCVWLIVWFGGCMRMVGVI